MFRVDQFAAPDHCRDLVACADGELMALVPVVVAWLVESGYAPGTARVAADMWDRFVGFAAAYDVTGVAGVTAEVAAGFVHAVGVDGTPPAVSTMHQRRSVLRLFFRVLHHVDPTISDPTWGLVLPTASTRADRPVTDAELDVLRAVSLHTIAGTRLPAVVALAEASATSMEITRVTATDVDIDAPTVGLPGSRGVSPRIGHLTDWGHLQLSRRLHDLRHTESPVAYDGSRDGYAAQSATSVALRRLLDRAGLTAEADLGLGSVRAWAGRRAFATTGRIEAAAAVLGCRSLDTTARLIGWDWQDPP